MPGARSLAIFELRNKLTLFFILLCAQMLKFSENLLLSDAPAQSAVKQTNIKLFTNYPKISASSRASRAVEILRIALGHCFRIVGRPRAVLALVLSGHGGR